MNVEIVINKEPSFHEVWHEGYVRYSGQDYHFWLIDPQGEDDKGREYEMEVRWFFKRVPMEVRAMQDRIINAFKNKQNDKRSEEN